MTKRRPQRQDCPECGNRVTVCDDGTLIPHYRGQGARIQFGGERRCPGGFDPALGGTIRPVAPPTTRYGAPLPSEGELSVRTISAGLPSSGRKR